MEGVVKNKTDKLNKIHIIGNAKKFKEKITKEMLYFTSFNKVRCAWQIL